MKKALVDLLNTKVTYVQSWTAVDNDYEPVEVSIENAAKLADIVEAGSEFPVASPYIWVDCPDDCESALWYYDTETQTCKQLPESVVKPSNVL